jgi:glucose-6-phosphate dehydrogenase assembly protein OpcA
MPPETFSPGMPVEIANIDRELKRLWIESGGVKTRASLVNLAVYSEAPGSLPENTKIISRITENHACRAIVIGANPSAKENRVEAWVSAHCHVSRSGNKQVCCEQLSFMLEGPCTKLLPNIVFSHLDSDLPFYLWWQGEFHESMDPQLWAWVDRVIYDSQQWSDFCAQMQHVETAQAEARQRILLCDLNWTRLVQLRLALAQFFDSRRARARFEEIKTVEIDFAPGYRSTALLLSGWLAAQLGWKVAAKTKDNRLAFRNQSGGAISISLNERGNLPISRCLLKCDEMEFRVSNSEELDLLHVTAAAPGETRPPQLMPAGSNDPVQLMEEELMGVGRHRVYLRAMNCVRDLL